MQVHRSFILLISGTVVACTEEDCHLSQEYQLVALKRRSTLLTDYDTFAGYRYSAFINYIDLSSKLIWEFYYKRADAENKIKELKYEYGMEVLHRKVGCHRTSVPYGDSGL